MYMTQCSSYTLSAQKPLPLKSRAKGKSKGLQEGDRRVADGLRALWNTN